jgi:hypothetical protein
VISIERILDREREREIDREREREEARDREGEIESFSEIK